MTIPLANLDDRSFDSLVEEARSVLAIDAPGWTNHNASDPGITLIELLAWVTEQLLYRLNLIGLDSKQSFLRLLRGRADGDVAADIDDIDETIRQQVAALARPMRAVTPADFEALALEAARAACGVGSRVCCVAGVRIEHTPTQVQVERRDSDFSVVVVPPRDHQGDATVDTLERIRGALAPACLLGSRVHVAATVRVSLAITATLHVDEHRPADHWLKSCRAALEDRFSPWPASTDNPHGWPFGRPVFLADVVEALEGVSGVEAVSDGRFVQAAMNADRVETDEALIGIQLGVVSLVGTTTRFGPAATLGPDRLIRGSDGRLTGFALRPYELAHVTLRGDGLRVVMVHDALSGSDS